MSRCLLIDIGAGTMDVLWHDDDSVWHYKAVAVSPVRTVAAEAERHPGDLLVTGCEMGGGPVTEALKRRAQTHAVVVSRSAAATLSHDLDKVAAWGIRVVPDAEAAAMAADPRFAHLELADLEPGRIARLVAAFGVPFEFDAVAVCAQDHGVPPPGVSHLDFRHRLYRERLEADPRPEALLFRADEVPPPLNRLAAIAASAARLPTREVYVMDSGMAAVAGASRDSHAPANGPFVVLDVATSHTVCAAVAGGELAALVEYHTADLTRERLEALLADLVHGRLDHRQVLAEGGHGAYTRRAAGREALAAIIATGPKRRLLLGSRLPIIFGAPLGDNMLTGCAGMLAALRRRQGLAPPVWV
jgi:uncharacterized protein (DUF1786 family)